MVLQKILSMVRSHESNPRQIDQKSSARSKTVLDSGFHGHGFRILGTVVLDFHLCQ